MSSNPIAATTSSSKPRPKRPTASPSAERARAAYAGAVLARKAANAQRAAGAEPCDCAHKDYFDGVISDGYNSNDEYYEDGTDGWDNPADKVKLDARDGLDDDEGGEDGDDVENGEDGEDGNDRENRKDREKDEFGDLPVEEREIGRVGGRRRGGYWRGLGCEGS